MNDTLYEQLVERKPGLFNYIARILIIAALVLLFVSAFLFGFIMTIICLILGILCWKFVLPRFHVEYEYALLNHELSIDVIYKKEKRKNLLSIDLKEAQLIAPRVSSRLDSFQNYKVKDCSTADASSTPYAIMCPIQQQMTCVLFNPDEEMLARIESFLPRTIYRD